MKDSLTGQASLVNELLSATVQPRLKELGLTGSMFELLSAIRASGGRATQIEIARRLGITAPSLSEAVRAAVGRGLVEQAPVEGDARAKLLQLTDAGRDAVTKVTRFVATVEREMLAGISEDEIATAIDVLRRTNRNLARRLSH